MSGRDLRSTERLIDANLNRAAEALRVVEDICRFHWNLGGFAADLKGLRHEVFAGVVDEGISRRAILERRDIAGDVGKENPSPPRPVESMEDVAFRNLERAKEAIRALEEACRASWPRATARLERARYTLYAVEKGLGHITDRSHGRRRIEDARLCLLATSSLLPEAGGHTDPARRIERIVETAVGAGVDVVQLREKGRSDRETLRIGRALREITARAGAILVVNDRPDLAAILHADGVHLGQDDLPVAEARSIVGDDRLVGVSTHSLEQARAAERDGADYIGIGPVFPSLTKDAGPLLGTAGLERILEQVSLPAFAIGGIGPERIAEIRRAGGRRVAVSSAILRAVDVQAVVRAFRESLGAGQG